MDRNQKKELVANLAKTLAETQVVVITRNHGLTVAQVSDLRTRMRGAGAQFKVTKNRLARIALEGTPYQDIGQQLVGPSFSDGRLAWYRACAVSEASYRTAVGPWRYALSARTYLRGAPGPIRVPGFADAGSRLYEVLGCTDAGAGAQGNADCRIDAITPPAYSAAPAPTR